MKEIRVKKNDMGELRGCMSVVEERSKKMGVT